MTRAERGAGGTAASAIVTSLAQGVAMLAGGLLAVLVAIRIGNTPVTDGFFAAYAVYSVAVLFASSVRVTVPARLVEGETTFGALDRFLASGLILLAALGVVVGPLGGLVADLLTGDLGGEARSTARDALLILWPAAAAQLFAALGAAMLGTLGNFTLPAFAFGAGGVISILAFLALEGPLGIEGLSVAILLGSFVTAAAVGAALVRSGWRPRAAPAGSALRAAGLLVFASFSFLLTQLGFVVTVAVAAHLGAGVVTVFTYAFSAMNVLVALLGSSVAMVLAAPLARTWDGSGTALLPHHRDVVQTGLLLLAPVVAAAWLVGEPVAAAVLTGFSEDEVELTVRLFLLLVPGVVGAIVLSLPQVALFARGRYRAVAAVSAAALTAQVAASLAAGAADSTDVLAAAVSVALVASALGTLALAAPGYLAASLPAMAAGILRVGVVAAVAFGVPALLLGDVPALLLGVVAYAAAVAVALPAERDLARRLVPVGR